MMDFEDALQMEKDFYDSMTNVHDLDICLFEGHCPVHSPTWHHMRTWPISWDYVTRGVFRQCPHGFVHPDPDQSYYWRNMGYVHIKLEHDQTCDGCCSFEPPF